MNEDLLRWLAAAVLKAGGEIYLTRDELNAAIDLKITSLDGDEGLRIVAKPKED